LDGNKDKKIEIGEVREALKGIAEDQIKVLFKKLDINKDNVIDADTADDKKNEVKQFVDANDENHDGNLDWTEFQVALGVPIG